MGVDENSDAQNELMALAARVAALERQVAELSGAARREAPPVMRQVRIAPPPAIPAAPPPLAVPQERQSLENRLGSRPLHRPGPGRPSPPRSTIRSRRSTPRRT